VQARAEKARIAVIGAEETEPLRSLLTAELSKSRDAVVVERGEFERITEELQLQTSGFIAPDAIRVGQLLNADALLVMTADNPKHLVTMRLIAVAPGVALTEDSVPVPLRAPEEWAPIAAGRLAPYLANLSTRDAKRIPLSILKVRAIGSGTESRRLEKEFGFLLSRRLMNEPSLWILERSQMNVLEWENALKANPQSSFWTGSYLLDGTITSDSDGLSVTGRLRPAGQGTEISLTARGADMLKLAEAVARQVTKSLNARQPSAPWDAMAEARQFLGEALWAYRWGLYEEASQAGEAAWALGLQDDRLALLRFCSEAIRLERDISVSDTHHPKKPALWTLDCASLALDRLQEGLAWKNGDLSEAWVGLGADCLWNSSLVLRAYYYAPSLEPNEIEALKALRARLRAICPLLKSAGERFPTPRLDENVVGFRPDAFAAPLHSLHTVRGIVEPIWQEDAQHCVDQMKLLFDEIDRLEPRTRTQVRAAILQERPGFAPWIAYWNPDDRSRVPLDSLKAALLDSPSPERPIDVALVMVERRSHVFLDYYSDRLEPDQMLISLRDLQLAFWNKRGAIARLEISAHRLSSVLEAIRQAERDTNEYASPQIDSEMESFRLDFFKFLLGEKVSDSPLLAVFCPMLSKLSHEEALEVLRLSREVLKQGGSPYYLRSLQPALEKAVEGTVPEKIAPRPALAGQNGLQPAWTVSGQEIVGDERALIGRVRWRNGRLWLMGLDSGLGVQKQANVLFTFDPKTAAAGKIILPAKSRLGFSDFDLVKDEIFASNQAGVARYIAAEDRWVDLPVPEVPGSSFWAIDGFLYVAGSPGIIVRVDPSTGRSDVLVSSRRRPALTNLDDVAPYDIEKVFKDSKGRLCILDGSGRIYRNEEGKSSWEEAFNGESARRGEKFDRELVLSAVGTEGFNPISVRPQMGGSLIDCLLIAESKVGRLPMPGPGGTFAFGPFGPRFMGAPGAERAAFDGTDLWVLSKNPSEQTCLLKRFSPAGESMQSIPIDIGKTNSMFRTDRMLVNENGILIYREKKAFFFRKDDLLRWRP
jgi:hypothetical protein